MKNNINLDDLFSKAKNAEPVFSKEDARNLIENAGISNTGGIIPNRNRGNLFMNIISAAALTATAAGVLCYNTFFDNQTNQNNVYHKSIQITQSEKIDKESKPNNASPTVAEVVNSSNSKATISIEQKNENPKKVLLKEENKTKDIIQGVKVIELSEEQARNIGISIGQNADCIEYVSGKLDKNPQIIKVFVDWGIGYESLKESDLARKLAFVEPRMVTDNSGNKRISTYNEDDAGNFSKMEYMDKDKNLYIQTLTNNDKDENINVVLGGVNTNSNNGDNKTQTRTYSNSNVLINSSHKPDYETSTVVVNDGNQVVVTDHDYFYSPEKITPSTMNFTTVVDVDSMLSNLNIEEIIKNSFKNLKDLPLQLNIPDSIKVMADQMSIPFYADSMNKFMKLFSEKFKLQFNIDSNSTDDMQKRIVAMARNYSNKKVDGDTLTNSNVQKDMIFICNDGQNSENDMNLNNTQIKIIKNCSTDKLVKIEDITNNLSSITDELIKLNKLVPVSIIIPNAKDRNGNELKNFKFLLWFEPTDEFVGKLPESIKTELQKELNTLKKDGDICEKSEAIAGKDAYLDVWRACSGAIENLTTYPNPVDNLINVRFKLNEKRTVTISIHDLNGRKVLELGKATLTNGEIERSFTIGNKLESGMYLIVAQTDSGEEAVQRIIIK